MEGSAQTAGEHARRRSLDELPGPPGLPVLGNALALKPGRVHTVVEEWARQYGDYFRFRIGARRILGVADPQAIQAVLKERPDSYWRTARAVQVGREIGLTGVFFANGDAWRRQWRIVMAACDPGHVKRSFPSLVNVTQRLQRRWRTTAETGNDIPLQSDLMRDTVDVTAGLGFGAEINTLESTREVIQQHLDQVLPMVSKRLIAPFIYWRVVKRPVDHRFDRHLREIHRAIGEFIARAGALLALIMRSGPLNERIFPDAARFDPARWLDGRQTEGAQSAAKRASMPFGAGPRLCPGRYLALQEIKMVMSMLLVSFDLERVEALDGGEVRERMDFTMAPTPLRMRLKARR